MDILDLIHEEILLKEGGRLQIDSCEHTVHCSGPVFMEIQKSLLKLAEQVIPILVKPGTTEPVYSAKDLATANITKMFSPKVGYINFVLDAGSGYSVQKIK